MSNKIAFLDIDGVLNSNQTCFYFRMNDINQNGYGGFFDKYETPTNANVCWGQDLVDNLRTIVEKTNAKIVISSTWRINHPVKQFIEMFKVYYWENAPVIDKTIHTGERRGYEIQDYLDKHPDVTNYVILDDSSDMLDSQREHFVKTSPSFGLTKEDAERAIAILERK